MLELIPIVLKTRDINSCQFKTIFFISLKFESTFGANNLASM